MKNSEIKDKLIGVLNQVKNKGEYGYTGYTANEVMRLIDQANDLIHNYVTASSEAKISKDQTLKDLKTAYKIAHMYFQRKHGFDISTCRNTKILPHMYVNKTYTALDRFISNMN
jgi:hypothetical protein